MPPQKRIRPKLTVTVDPDVVRRLEQVQSMLPGSSLSGIVSELLEMSLPVMEGMVAAMRGAVASDGSFSEDVAKDALARWAGAQLLGLSDTDGDLPGKE